MQFSDNEINQEKERLIESLKLLSWTEEDCKIYAPLTLEINTLKKQQNAIILAHSYQSPDIMYGIADFIGDSYGLSLIARDHPAEKIIFCSVHFMGETAKLLNPKKEVLVPKKAGCSLSESITVKDIIKLKKKHPGVPIVCYVNTSAQVKAHSDICCTSANALKIINSLSDEKIIFIPDELMGKNIQTLTKKEIITWPGRCIVHENFDANTAQEIKKQHPKVKILAHLECSPKLIKHADMAGSTTDMLNYVKTSNSDTFMLVTECGITDRVKKEFPKKKIVGSCSLCPYMKKIELRDVLKALQNPSHDQIINIPKNIAEKAQVSLEKMMELSK